MDNNMMEEQRAFLLKIARVRMPFGKYKDRLLVSIPDEYYVWFRKKGFPPGELGRCMEAMAEIKENGLEPIIYELIKRYNIR